MAQIIQMCECPSYPAFAKTFLFEQSLGRAQGMRVPGSAGLGAPLLLLFFPFQSSTHPEPLGGGGSPRAQLQRWCVPLTTPSGTQRPRHPQQSSRPGRTCYPPSMLHRMYILGICSLLCRRRRRARLSTGPGTARACPTRPPPGQPPAPRTVRAS